LARAGVAGTVMASYSPGNSIEDSFDMTSDEKRWFYVFLEGNAFFCGWNEISENLLARIPDRDEREMQRDALQELGFKIGIEWAKNNDVRRIDNSLLMKWGNELKEAAKKIPDHIPEVIAEIDSQVNYILYR